MKVNNGYEKELAMAKKELKRMFGDEVSIEVVHLPNGKAQIRYYASDAVAPEFFRWMNGWKVHCVR